MSEGGMGRRALAGLLAQAFAGRDVLGRGLRDGVSDFKGARNYYEVLGYPKELAVEDYAYRYERQDIAAVVVEAPAEDTWANPPQVTEEGEETDFTETWDELTTRKRIGVWDKISRADVLSGIGEFGILLLGIDDDPDEDADPSNHLAEPVTAGAVAEKGLDGLLYMRPFSEKNVTVREISESPTDQRYGLPELYEIELSYAKGTTTEVVHWSRVIHLAEGKTDNEVRGRPRLKRCFNRLNDLMKLVGGSAESTWLNMRPGLLLQPKEGYDFDSMSEEDWEEEIEAYADDVLRILRLVGADLSVIGTGSVTDASSNFWVCIALISAATRIPQRRLLGSQQGALASSTQDEKQWAGYISGRQKRYAEPQILRPLIDRLIFCGVLPGPDSGTYHIGTLNDDGEWEWPSLIESSPKEEMEIANLWSRAVATLRNPATMELPATMGEVRQHLGLARDLPEDEILTMMKDAAEVRGLEWRPRSMQAADAYERGRLEAEEFLNIVMEEAAETE